jgi:hypothetical protein
MKNIYSILICICVLFQPVLTGCEEKIDYSHTKKPEITLILDQLEPDMNKTDNIPLLCVIFSEAGLSSVEMYAVRDSEESFYKRITEFYDNKQYSLKEYPQWEETITAFRIVAIDAAKRSTEAMIPVSVIKYKMPPVIRFELPEIVIDETQGVTESPVTKFEVHAAAMLAAVEITLFGKTGPTQVEPNPRFVAGRDSVYRFEQEIVYQEGDVALQVKATDEYGKLKIETLPIKYTPVPAPEWTVTGATTLDPIVARSGTSKTLTLKATSPIGIMAIKVLKVEKEVETTLSTEYYDSQKEVDFTAELTHIEASWNAVKIVAYDQLGRNALVEIPTIIDLRYQANMRIGSQYYSKTADPEYPDTYCFFSVNDLATYDLNYFFTNKSNIDLYFYLFLGAPDIRIYSATVNRNDAYCAGWSTDVANAIPAMVDGEAAWDGKNNTLTKQYTAGSWPFDFDNATAADLESIRDGSFFNSGGGTIAGLKTGDAVFFKTAATSTAPSTVGIMRIESWTWDTTTKWKGYFMVSFKILQ